MPENLVEGLRKFGSEKLVALASDGLFSGIAVEFFGPFVPVGDAIFFIAHDEAGEVQEAEEAIGIGAGSFELGYVAGYFRRAHDLPLFVSNRGNREGDIDKMSVFSAAYGFEVLNPLALGDARRISCSSAHRSGGISMETGCPIASSGV